MVFSIFSFCISLTGRLILLVQLCVFFLYGSYMEVNFLIVWEPRNQEERMYRFELFIMCLLGLQKKQLCFCSMPGFISVHTPMSFPFLIKAPILWDTDFTIMTSFQFSYLKSNHTGNHDSTEMEWNKIGPITLLTMSFI